MLAVPVLNWPLPFSSATPADIQRNAKDEAQHGGSTATLIFVSPSELCSWKGRQPQYETDSQSFPSLHIIKYSNIMPQEINHSLST